MAQALKRAPWEPQGEALASKRRRFSPDELGQELEAAGKRQPVLSFLLGPAQAEVKGLGAARRHPHGGGAGAPKRVDATQGPRGSSKRPKQCEAGLLPLKELAPLMQMPRQFSLVRPRPPASAVPPGPALRPAGVMVDPRGTAFVVTESGYLLAELPSCCRPGITLAGNRRVQVARVAIDAAGTAYLFSEEGLPLTAVPAVSLARDACSGDAVTIQMLDREPRAGTPHPGWLSQAALLAEDPLIPSTDVPSPSDTVMDWEPL